MKILLVPDNPLNEIDSLVDVQEKKAEKLKDKREISINKIFVFSITDKGAVMKIFIVGTGGREHFRFQDLLIGGKRSEGIPAFFKDHRDIAVQRIQFLHFVAERRFVECGFCAAVQ